MSRTVLALGLDPQFADYTEMPGLTPAMVRAYIDQQIEVIRTLGYKVETCYVDAGETAESVLDLLLEGRTFDCVLIGAGLRAAAHLLLFEKLLNLIHEKAPRSRLCFNSNPADSAEAVQRWI